MKVEINHSEALKFLSKQPANSFDAILCDPPAGISFMSASWDSDKGGRDAWVKWLTKMMRQVYRVLKPGAHGLVWSFPITSHWTGWALEEAGFDIRNCVYHLVGNRMPKNHNASKAADRQSGTQRRVVGIGKNVKHAFEVTDDDLSADKEEYEITAATSDDAALLEGHGTALRSLVEPWWLIRKPLEGTILDNFRKWGTGTINVDGCRIESQGRPKIVGRSDLSLESIYDSGMRGSTCEGTTDEGRWPANCILSGDVARDLDASIGERPSTLTGRADPYVRHANPGDNGGASSFGGGNSAVYADEGGPSKFFKVVRPTLEELEEADEIAEGASFYAFTSKVGTWEREFGCEALPLRSAGEIVGRKEGTAGIKSGRAGAGRSGSRRNVHPTMKGIELTEYLAKLLLVPHRGVDRRIIIPFAGVGSEMIGAYRAGFEDVVGIEADFDNKGFIEIARARIARWREVPRDMSVEDVRATAAAVDPRQASLFDLTGTK